MNRVQNRIFENMFGRYDEVHYKVLWHVANSLGDVYRSFHDLSYYVRGDFLRCLQALEACYDALEDGDTKRLALNAFIRLILSESDIDLGISWQPPIFVRSGAGLLDIHLVNEPLRWLSDPKYKTVYEPFEKGLGHFLEAGKKHQLLQDVITDMYESLEALSKLLTGRPNKDLSANAELFISSVKASPEYKEILKEYVSYANKFRHAADPTATKPTLSPAEVESFIYLTGIFIRLGLQK